MVHFGHEDKMSEFYIKNEKDKFIPIKFSSVLARDLDGKLVIVRVGTDANPASESDMESTEESFRQADVITNIDVSLILTPYQIDIGAIKKEDIQDKHLYVQVTSGDNLSSLEALAKKIYNKLKSKFKSVILPIPLTIKQYSQVKDILRRSQIRKDRRARVKG